MTNPYQDDGMHKGAKPDTFSKAEYLRKNMTDAEKILWEKLKKKETLGYRFRRQHPFGHYILDFYSHKFKLCIEVDGEYHNSKEQQLKDKERDNFLEFNDIVVIRFTNEEIFNDIEGVIHEIKSHIIKLESH